MFHYYESMDTYEFLISNGNIRGMYFSWDVESKYDIHIYNNNVLREILTFDSKSNSFTLDSININNINESVEYLKKNHQFKLYSQKKYNYDSNNKLISVEFVDLKSNDTKINYIEYNSKGLISKDENGSFIEYEYYN